MPEFIGSHNIVDYENPRVKTTFPAPEHAEGMLDLDTLISGEGLTQQVTNLRLSKGNFFKDQDGNTILDLFMSGGRMPLGYNHRYLVDSRLDAEVDKYLTPSDKKFPSTSIPDLMR